MVIQSCLVDTNVLLRMTRRSDEQAAIRRALAHLRMQDATLCYTHQNIAELWNVLTRPAQVNGFGLSVTEAETEVHGIETAMRLLVESAAVYREWRRIVLQYGVSGTQVYDARLVAAMYVHNITHILTLNTSDFQRYLQVVAIHPSAL
jgi:predicted nucleic acid-binding protein